MQGKEKGQARGPNRYPLKDHEAAKRTIARLTREVLRGDIDPEKCRAAIYCIDSLIQIFKIEAPQKIEAQFAGALKCEAKTEMTAEELQKQIDELIPGYDDYLLWAEKRKRKEAIKKAQIAYSDPEPLPEPEPESKAEDIVTIDAEAWKPAGIGARRRK
jgi:hypothetical protein